MLASSFLVMVGAATVAPAAVRALPSVQSQGGTLVLDGDGNNVRVVGQLDVLASASDPSPVLHMGAAVGSNHRVGVYFERTAATGMVSDYNKVGLYSSPPGYDISLERHSFDGFASLQANCATTHPSNLAICDPRFRFTGTAATQVPLCQVTALRTQAVNQRPYDAFPLRFNDTVVEFAIVNNMAFDDGGIIRSGCDCEQHDGFYVTCEMGAP